MAFANIEGTAGWYYNKWPGYLTVNVYRIMEAFSSEHIRTKEQFQCTEQGSKILLQSDRQN